MIISNLSFLLYFSLLYIAGLSFLYFSKARINNMENRVYKWLLGLNMFGVFLQILCDLVSAYYDVVPLIFSQLVLRLYLAYFVAWINTMLDYLLTITFNNKREIVWFNIGLTIFEVIAVMFLPFQLFRDNINKVYYTYGLAIKTTFSLSSILMLVMFSVIIVNMKKLQRKKVVPILLFMLSGVIATLIQKFNPSVVIIAPMETFICSLMYFTIENPDLKMLNELELAKKNAERANNAKTEFLSNMSHEIRTPLNAIVGFSNSIMEDDSLEEAQNEARDIIMASNNLLEIVNGILDISKIEAGKMEIVNVNYKPRVVFNDLVKLIKPRIVEKPIELKVNFSDDIPYELNGDMGKVKEIITNLLTNAAKYTEKGVIEFSVSCINDNDTSKLVMSVEDTGRGIKSDKIDKLFSKFDRLDEDKNTTLEGTGLGLAITKSLIEMMGGKIIVQSKYGSGSKFTVYLSQKIVSMVDDGKDEEVVLDDDNIDYSDKKLLVVDDNNLNIKVAARMLKNYNIVPDTCLDGYECLDKVKSNKYDLILLDDMMPKMSGVETLGKLKEDSDFDTPVVVLTANAISGMREKYLKDGFNDYLAKPIDKLELRRVLKEFLEKK